MTMNTYTYRISSQHERSLDTDKQQQKYPSQSPSSYNDAVESYTTYLTRQNPRGGHTYTDSADSRTTTYTVPTILVFLFVFLTCLSVWGAMKLYQIWCSSVIQEGQDEQVDAERGHHQEKEGTSVIDKVKQIEGALQQQKCSMVVKECDIVVSNSSSNKTEATTDDDEHNGDLECQVESEDEEASEIEQTPDIVLSNIDFSDRNGSHDHDDVDEDYSSLLILPRKHHSTIHSLCAICIESYKAGDKVIWSSNSFCIHCFHYDCFVQAAETAIKRKKNGPFMLLCPICRQPFLNQQHCSRKEHQNAESS